MPTNSTDADRKFLRQAIELAREHMTAGHGGPFGAVIARDGIEVARGWNQVTSANDPTAHAEVIAIRAAAASLGRFELRGCVLYTSCEPCPMCLSAAYWARLDRIVFAAGRGDAADAGFDDEALYRQLALPIAERQLPMIQWLRAEACDVFAQWKTMPNKIPY